ncbi:hypothetical protein PILCRDRAFT_85940 [Piloderma croceum F 1598]|uniref:MYND-type domain-containing protein n=1 Tax=Piloderma croceum (strain F 1598) TaxID=765440 RepID=A0A0C3FTE1_PILCF|nr:hypothetical protein PILCRDRAFT_85940 [Piloderma croceum F 1598]
MTAAEQRYTSLLDPLAFPPFLSCPDEHVYDHQRGSSPVQHWCFLGEIEEISGIGRLCLDVKDREGITVRIYFYLDRLSPSVREIHINPPRITYPKHANVPSHLVQKGYTIAVLYAQQHRWLAEASTGIRIEDGDMVQIFPCSLSELLSLGDRILQRVPQSKTAAELRTCGWCGEKAASLLCCSACGLAWYCNKGCQRIDWPGHKKDCKLTSQVGLLMKQHWSHVEPHFKFPLSTKP